VVSFCSQAGRSAASANRQMYFFIVNLTIKVLI
jgi:hypothetical protein